MREYGIVRSRFWDWARRKRLSLEARLLAIFLLCGPHTLSVGCFRVPTLYLAADLGMDPDTVRAILSQLNAAGFVERDEASGWTWIVGFLEHNPIPNSNMAKSMISAIESVPSDLEFYQRFVASLTPFAQRFPAGFLERMAKRSPNPSTNGSGNGLPNGSGKGLGTGMPTQDQDQDQDQDQEQDQGRRPTTPSVRVAPRERDARRACIDAIEAVFPDLQHDLAFPRLTASLGMVDAWFGEGVSLERDILPTITALCSILKARGDGPPRSMNYFRQAVADARATNERGLPDGQPDSFAGRSFRGGDRRGARGIIAAVNNVLAEVEGDEPLQR